MNVQPTIGLMVLEFLLLVIFINLLRKPQTPDNRKILFLIYAVVFCLAFYTMANAAYVLTNPLPDPQFPDLIYVWHLTILVGSVSGVMLAIFTISYLYLKSEEDSMSREPIP